MIAKVTKQPKPKKLKEGEVEKPHTLASRSDTKQARLKCSSKFNICRKKILLSVSIKLGQCFISKGVIACHQALWGTLAAGREKEGECASMSPEFEYLCQKS